MERNFLQSRLGLSFAQNPKLNQLAFSLLKMSATGIIKGNPTSKFVRGFFVDRITAKTVS